MCGYQAARRGLLGKSPDIFEKLSGIGNMMPGYIVEDEEGNEKTVWDMPTQDEINEQDTPFLRSCFSLRSRFKVGGLPHGKGFLHERGVVIEIIALLENEENKYESWHFKNRDHLGESD